GIGFLVMTTWFTLQVFERIQEMVRILDRHSVARQELLVENIQMERLSKLDPLTQLYNRQALADYLARVIEVCQHHALDLHLAVVDVDDFKQINDSFGHDVGDLVLKGVAELMRQQLPTDHFVARYGGEEFVVLGIGIPFHTFYEQMERLRVQVSAQPLTARPVTVSIGIHTHVPGETAAQLFRYADQNLYWSKGQGKNQVRTSWDGDPQRPDDPPQAPALT
ncbi:MAG: GGDEF domain-containing protein, partial [Alicyclobacillus sp.]|nr:GGDEF domain-containing protein [Alicyclobacillus sp.]